jgi:hypothetical protein
MTVQKIWVGCVDVTCLGGDHVTNELVGGGHEGFEEGDYDQVKSILELGVSLEGGLQSAPPRQMKESTHSLAEQLTED